MGDGAEADEEAYVGRSLRFDLTDFAGSVVAFCAPRVPVVAFAAVVLRVVRGAHGAAPRLRFIGAIFVGQGGMELCYMRIWGFVSDDVAVVEGWVREKSFIWHASPSWKLLSRLRDCLDP